MDIARIAALEDLARTPKRCRTLPQVDWASIGNNDLRNYSAGEMRFGMRYADALTTARDGTPVLDLTRIGALEPDVADRQEQGWTERDADG